MSRKLFLVFMVLILLAGAVEAAKCDKVVFNKDSGVSSYKRELVCAEKDKYDIDGDGDKTENDGLCPAHYGDWSDKNCDPNLGTGQKCHLCDPDCCVPAGSDCCSTWTIDDFLPQACPDSEIDVTVRGTNLGAVFANIASVDKVYADLLTADLGYTVGSLVLTGCSTGSCSGAIHLNTKYIGPEGGSTYDFVFIAIGVDSSGKILGQIGNNLQLSGVAGPRITISSPTNDEKVVGDVVISADANYASGADVMYEYKIERKSSGDYKPVNVKGNLGHCGWCNPDLLNSKDCNTLHSEFKPSSDTSSATWDTTVCDNNDFRITVEAAKLESVESGETGIKCSGYVDVRTNNEVPGVPGRPNVLNLMIARVKSWM